MKSATYTVSQITGTLKGFGGQGHDIVIGCLIGLGYWQLADKYRRALDAADVAKDDWENYETKFAMRDMTEEEVAASFFGTPGKVAVDPEHQAEINSKMSHASHRVSEIEKEIWRIADEEVFGIVMARIGESDNDQS